MLGGSSSGPVSRSTQLEPSSLPQESTLERSRSGEHPNPHELGEGTAGVLHPVADLIISISHYSHLSTSQAPCHPQDPTCARMLPALVVRLERVMPFLCVITVLVCLVFLFRMLHLPLT
jgi:hypothetical protein